MTQALQKRITYHGRTITDIKYNNDGDLLFVGSKDATASVIRENILGTYAGHEGAINVIDVNQDSTLLVTGGSDRKLILWDVETGVKIKEYIVDSVVKSLSFFNDKILFLTDDSFKATPKIGIIDNAIVKERILNFVPTKGVIDFSCSRIMVGDNDGLLHKFNNDLEPIKNLKIHNERVTNVKNSFCNSFFVTSSNDCTSKIVDYGFNIVKTFVSEENTNCGAIFRTNDILVSAGGLSARDVTTTRSNSNFSVNFFDIIDCKLKGSYSTHFGTINCLDIHPSCTKYASGGEDAAICIVEFGDDLNNVEWIFDEKQRQELELEI